MPAQIEMRSHHSFMLLHKDCFALTALSARVSSRHYEFLWPLFTCLEISFSKRVARLTCTSIS